MTLRRACSRSGAVNGQAGSASARMAYQREVSRIGMFNAGPGPQIFPPTRQAARTADFTDAGGPRRQTTCSGCVRRARDAVVCCLPADCSGPRSADQEIRPLGADAKRPDTCRARRSGLSVDCSGTRAARRNVMARQVKLLWRDIRRAASHWRTRASPRADARRWIHYLRLPQRDAWAGTPPFDDRAGRARPRRPSTTRLRS